jgi:hypothetical protein
MSANAKLILYNEMRELRLPPAQSPVEPGRAKLGTSLLLSAANLPLLLALLLGAGIVFCQAGDAKVYKARADVAAPQCDRDGTERNGPYPQV